MQDRLSFLAEKMQEMNRQKLRSMGSGLYGPTEEEIRIVEENKD